MHTTRLGPSIHKEGGYRVREVFDAVSGRSEGFTFEGPGFGALIVYRDASEAKAALLELVEAIRAKTEPPNRGD
jgi:hypothetical protein